MDDESPLAFLVPQAAAGSQSAWNSLVERFAPLVMSVIRGYRLGEKDAEDVFQTVWLRLVEHLDVIREPRALPMWIVTTSKHECLRLLQVNQRTQPFDPLEETCPANVPTGGAVDDDLLREERHTALLQGFASLPDNQRELLLLLAKDPPVPYKEISRRLGIPIGSIGPTRARALQRLRESPAIASLASGAEQGLPGGGRHDSAAVGR